MSSGTDVSIVGDDAILLQGAMPIQPDYIPLIFSNIGSIVFHIQLTDSGVQHISKKRRYPEGHFRFSLLNYCCSAMSRRRLVSGRIHKNQGQTDISGESRRDQSQQYETNDGSFGFLRKYRKAGTMPATADGRRRTAVPGVMRLSTSYRGYPLHAACRSYR